MNRNKVLTNYWEIVWEEIKKFNEEFELQHQHHDMIEHYDDEYVFNESNGILINNNMDAFMIYKTSNLIPYTPSDFIEWKITYVICDLVDQALRGFREIGLSSLVGYVFSFANKNKCDVENDNLNDTITNFLKSKPFSLCKERVVIFYTNQLYEYFTEPLLNPTWMKLCTELNMLYKRFKNEHAYRFKDFKFEPNKIVKSESIGGKQMINWRPINGDKLIKNCFFYRAIMEQ